MMIKIENEEAAERARARRGDKSVSAMVRAMIDAVNAPSSGLSAAIAATEALAVLARHVPDDARKNYLDLADGIKDDLMSSKVTEAHHPDYVAFRARSAQPAKAPIADLAQALAQRLRDEGPDDPDTSNVATALVRIASSIRDGDMSPGTMHG